MYQIVHDYAWELEFREPLLGRSGDLVDHDLDFDFSGFIRSNLVVMFSPICRSLNGLCEYFDVDDSIGDEMLSNFDAFYEKFSGFFRHVKDAFVCRGIHFSWVDVRYELECDKIDVEIDKHVRLKMFESGIKILGWGFCSSAAIVLGSALVPFGLIYPMIGVSSKFFDFDNSCRKAYGKLNLEILDVSGKPLECKCCDLQLLEMKILPRSKLMDLVQVSDNVKLGNGGCGQAKAFWDHIGDGFTRIAVKGAGRNDEIMKVEGHLIEVILVHGFSGESKNKTLEFSGEFFADRVLEILTEESSKFVKTKPVATWQIFLSFLYRRGYWALASLETADDSTYMGIIKPFTIHSALLYIMNGYKDTPFGVHNLGELNLSEFIKETKNGIGINDIDTDNSNRILGGQSRRKNKKHARKCKDLSWSSFCDAAHGNSNMELEDAYFSQECNNSKKLKFMKCWMKQVDKNSFSHTCVQMGSKLLKEESETVEDRSNVLHEESERPASSSFSAGQDNLPEPSKVEGSTPASVFEASEGLFSNLSERIQHGLQSGVDLVALAHRLVNLSIHWLNKKAAVDTDKGQASAEKTEDSNCFGVVVGELSKTLLKDPKDLAGKHKDNDPSLEVCEGKTTKFLSEDRVREYELQIFFRMEILQSEVAVDIKESMKRKFVKQICSLLEIVQYNLDGGLLGNFDLNDYIGRIIKSRYSQNLGDVVHSIYEQMDLLLFDDDEDESPNPLLNSEESSQSWKNKIGGEEIGDNDTVSESHSTEGLFPQYPGNNHESNKGNTNEEHARRLFEAQEKRQRAWRFSSFTRGRADLQRVWAPKQPKLSRSKSDSLQRPSRKKDRRNESCDRVCETPMTGKKHLCPPQSSFHDEIQEQGSGSSGSVYKALFQDDF
ncbi:hypothetical protein Ancab_009868 [Ancistrocladus abbreviatus]